MSTGQNGQQINVGDYVKVNDYSVGVTPAQRTSFIGVVLYAGATLSGVYLTSAGALVPFSGVDPGQCLQLGQAAGPGNAGFATAQN